MAHFAKLDLDSKVVTVEVVSNDIATTEQAGVDFLNTLYGTSDVWKQTSYNTVANEHKLGGTPFRKNFAGMGYTYDSDKDAFIGPQPYASWILDETTCTWKAPIPYPDDGLFYKWDEQTYQEDNEKVFALNQGSGVSNSPVLDFKKGNTYVFDVSDSSVDGCSLGFKFNHDEKEYTRGVTVSGTAGTSGAKVTIVLDTNTPDKLKYYCKTNGNKMGNIIFVESDGDGSSNNIAVTVVNPSSGLGWLRY
tara:strand:- start:316 stop:1059 length:744 start_codon:yes stop_codon:yes gene_type:complete